MRVLVTDAASRVALAVVRALGREGAEVAVVEQDRHASKTPAAFLSKHVRRTAILPSLDREEDFVAALAREASLAEVVLPVSTHVLLACARHRERIPAKLPVAPLETIRRANDKSAVLAVARKAGVPIPVGWAPEDEEELDGVVSAIRFPAVVKLRDDEGTELDPARRYAVVETPEALRAAWRELHRIRPFPLVQQRVEGEGFGVGVLAREGRVLASFSHRRVREYPVSGGPSALCESVKDPRLADYAARIIGALGWTGVAMVEFKKDDDYRLMEVNPRFWGSLPLAVEAGVNFPWLLCRLAAGEEPGAPDYAEGVRLRFLAMDLAAAWSALTTAARPGTYVLGFLRDLFDFDVRDGILDSGDLRASLAYLLSRLP
jgi:predicted ATP-grasp superfamily ATP-dependent carboligase